tara:strand:+ start:2455 stop:3312 length:858 start_codon:yes stop_codon:yes gene_type:complete
MSRDFSPKVKWKVSTDKLESELVRLAAITGEDIGEILRQEGRLAAGLLMDFTPPFKKYGKKAGAKKAGDTRIKIEVDALFLAGSEFKGNSQDSLISKIGKASKAGDTNALAVLLPSAGIDITSNRIHPTDLDNAHQSSRGFDGRVKGKRKRGGKPPKGYYVRNRYLARTRVEINRQTKRAQKNVGKAKSGWLAGLSYFGGKAASYITRHGIRRGTFADHSKDKRNPYILLENRVKYMDELDMELNITRNAANKRKKAIESRIKTALRNRARETQTRANRPRAKAA